MLRRYWVTLAASVVIVCTLGTTARAQRVSGEAVNAAVPKSLLVTEFEALAVAAQPLVLPPLTADERAPLQRSYGKRVLVGLERQARDEGDSPLPAVQWTQLSDGRHTARVSVKSPDALSLRVGVRMGTVPPGAELRVAGPDGVVQAVLDHEILSRTNAGVYWTPLIDGESQLLEWTLSAGVAPPELTIAYVSHGIARLADGLKSPLQAKAAGSCNIDVACVNNPSQALKDAINSVAKMLFVRPGEGSFFCTGTLLNDTDTTTTIDYFITNNHCFENEVRDASGNLIPGARVRTAAEMQGIANTLETVWLDQAATCGGTTSTTTQRRTGGAQFVYNEPGYDALLLRLNQAPPTGAYRSGWDADLLPVSQQGFALHHPSGDLKKISRGTKASVVTLSIETSPRSELFNRINWDFDAQGRVLGVTEGGSSGSGFFVPDANQYYWRGGLYGGASACGLPASSMYDFYSRFDLWYPQVAKFLSPQTGTCNTADPALDCDGDGVPNGVEAQEGLNPIVKDNDVIANTATGRRLFVMQTYRDLLVREATGAEITAGVNALNAGTTKAAFIESVINTVEYQDLGGPVTRLYTAYFLRVPDVGGMNFWIGAYKQGNPWTFIDISNFFVISAEFKQRYGALTNEQFVTLIYQNVLGRAPDPTGLAFWVDELNSGRRTAGQVMADFSESPENKITNKAVVQVAAAYNGVLKQAADPAQVTSYTPIVNGGGSIQPLINALLASPAYRARFLP